MKKVLAVLAFWVLMFIIASQAQAEQILSLENGNLVVKEVKELRRIPGVPEGISAEAAYKLATGEHKQSVIRDKVGKERYYLTYPLKKTITFSDQAVTYEGEKYVHWIVSRVEEKPDLAMTFFWLWLPGLAILLISVVNALSGIGTRKLFIFYASMFAGVLVGMSAGGFAGGFAGMFAGMSAGGFAGVLAGVLAGGFAGMSAGGFAGVSAGGLAGVLAGGFAGVLAGGQNYEIVMYYSIFLFIAELICFALGRIAGTIKEAACRQSKDG